MNISLKKIVFFCSTFILLFLAADVSWAVNCTTMGLYCQAPNGGVYDEWYFDAKIDGGSCVPRRRPYSCSGTDTACFNSGTGWFYPSAYACANGSPISYYGCCGSTRSCTPGCSIPSCDTGTSTSGTGDRKNIKSCTDSCGTTFTRSCYYICTPITCSSLPPLPDGRIWQDTCPLGETCTTKTGDFPISSPPPGCPTTTNLTCSVINNPPSWNDNELEIRLGVFNPPTALLQNLEEKSPKLFTLISKLVKPTYASDDLVLGFTSDTHTGRDLNNPLEIVARYLDSDGIEDMKAIYVWFSEDTDETKSFITPNRIADPSEGLTAQVETTSNWGFMVERTDGPTGNWDNFYVPHIEDVDGDGILDGEDDASWVLAGTRDVSGFPDISILGPDGQELVFLYNFSFTYDAANQVEMNVNMNVNMDNVEGDIYEGTYNVWALAQDVAGFLPFDRYGEIDQNFWRNSDVTWDVDLTDPTFEFSNTKPTSEKNVTLEYKPLDNLSNPLPHVRIDACRSAGVNNETISSTATEFGDTNPSYIMHLCSTFFNEYPDSIDVTCSSGDCLFHEADSVQLYRNVRINTGDNSAGSITFRITVIDDAGNYVYSDLVHYLGDWAITKNSFVYGSNGVTSNTRPLEDTAWDGLDISLLDYPYSFLASKADLSDSVLMGGNSYVNEVLGDLVKPDLDINRSLKVSQFPGVFISLPYEELSRAFSFKSATLDNLELVEDPSTLSGSMIGDVCSPLAQYCVVQSTTDLSISSGFNCNGKGLVLVNGNITINPDIENTSTSDACIIVASGNITIAEGSVASEKYNKVNAYMVANGNIILSADSNEDGLVVEGGLAAFGPDSSTIQIDRSMNILDRNIYPVLAVNNNPKYGILAKKLFGSQIDVFKVEVGFKPY